MLNVGFIKLRHFSDGRGFLVPIELGSDIPFNVKRIYYIGAVDHDVIRGRHAHKALHQILICISGSVTVTLDNTIEKQEIVLDDPTIGLHIGPLVWREMAKFSVGAVLLVLASQHYDESDYLRSYEVFQGQARRLFGG